MTVNKSWQQKDIVRKPKQRHFPVLIFLSVVAATFGFSGWSAMPRAQTKLPTDAQPLCDDLREIEGWFDQYGNVGPPDNKHFNQTRRGTVGGSQEQCIFFETSMHMFLWLTSVYRERGDEPIYRYDSPLFYRVGLPDKRGYRRLIRNDGRHVVSVGDKTARSFAPSISQLGANNAPVVFDDQGGIHSFVDYAIPQDDLPEVCNNNTPPVAIRDRKARVSCPGENDSAARVREAQVREGKGAKALGEGRPIMVNGMPVYLDEDGNAIASTPGQVCDKILVSRGNKLVYYNLEVNDVYAYFRTGAKQRLFDFNHFPDVMELVNQNGKTDDITEIKEFAKSHHASLPDEKALAIELKTAWIEIEEFDKRRFVTTWAEIPVFNRANPLHWRADGWKKVRLGLVGMHIVFSVAGHREMIWATFEHVDNAPDDAYEYCEQSAGPGCKSKINDRDVSRSWLFSANNSQSSLNRQLAYLYKGDICSYNGNMIGPNNVLRKYAWGSLTRPEFNTEIINVNKNVYDSLPVNDRRKNYVLIGSIWTGGETPPGVSQEGSIKLVNMTMETFFQGSNCFDCHQDRSHTVEMSHIFDQVRPLFERQRPR